MASFFVKYLEFDAPTYLLDMATTASPTNIYSVGRIDTDGLFTKVNSNGNVDWALRYTFKGQQIVLRTIVECDNGDFMIYGSQRISSSNNLNLVFRTDTSGNVLWSRTYGNSKTRFNIRLVKSVKDTYYMVSWYIDYSSLDDIELIKINGAGFVLGASRIGNSADEQVNGMIAHEDGVVLYGATSAGAGWDNFILFVNGKMQQVWGYLVGDKSFQEIREMIYLGKDEWAVTGETGTDRLSFFFTFKPGQATFQVSLYDLYPNHLDTGFKRMIQAGKSFYVVTERAGQVYPVITKLKQDYSIAWRKRLETKSVHRIRDLKWDAGEPNILRLAGYVEQTGRDAFLLSTDLDMDTCITVDMSIPKRSDVTFGVKSWRPNFAAYNFASSVVELSVSNLKPDLVELCEGGTDVSTQGALFQSPYTYIQAAGSDESDDSVNGFHLRWAFQRSLGDKHLPKGDLSGPSGAYPSTNAFNRDDDFVNVYRGLFREEFFTTVNLSTPPSSVVESGGVRRWIYNGIVPVASQPSNTNTVEIDFLDTAQYDALRSVFNPFGASQSIVNQYQGVMEAKVKDKLSVLAKVPLGIASSGSTTTGFVQIETISISDPLDPSTIYLSCREDKQGLGAGSNVKMECENIQRIRFRYANNVSPTQIQFITYEDYLIGVKDKYPSSWTQVGRYGLSLDNASVYKELEDTSKFTVHNKWRKFNEPNAGGQFRVSVPNYKTRWTQTDGLKSGVTKYLQLSQTDPEAIDFIPNSDPNTNGSAMEVSYLDLLNMVGTDFHVARMLGLGTIDPQSKTTSTAPPRFVYLMEYITEASLDGEPAAFVRHLYMTPPVTVLDHKLPPPPVLDDVSYGLFSNNKTGNPTPLTDPNGYTPYADIRFVNLSKQPFRYELPFEGFFFSDTFCLCDETMPVGFGVEYAAGSVGTGSWVRPELVNDSDFFDPGGMPEVMPLMETGENPIYRHQETQSGIHHYAMYSINWFSRVSPVGNEVETDNTQFPKRSTLLPPLNLAVQLIQEELPLILTSLPEQTMLSGLSGDKTLMRANFDWNYIHNQAYQFADKVELYFRVDPPEMVKGKIASGSGAVSVDTVNHLVTIETAPYTITSTSPSQTVQPNIPLADKAKFIGTTLVANGVAFIVDDIITTAAGNNPEIVLKQIRETHSQEVPANSNTWCTTETWVSPNPGEMFILYEDIGDPNNWDQVMTKEVSIVNFSPTHTETVTYSDGTTVVKQMGGLTDLANIAHVYDPDPGAPANTPTGVYTVTLNTKSLGSHPDADVEFRGGVVRIEGASGDIKELQVWQINDAGSTLVLTAYDPSFIADPIITALPASQSNVSVNYHPSYRAYFKVDGNFNETNTLPGFGEGTRETYIAARSKDSSIPCESYLSPPTVLLAREIREPVPPGVPQGPVFATRPNFYGKATYTFDSVVDRPFSLIFYRANERKILDTLYDPATVVTILADLEALISPDADFFQDRWNDLVNMNLDGSGNFKDYTSGGYRFPMPDSSSYTIPHPDANVQETPLDNGLTLNDNFTYFDTLVGANVTLAMTDVVKDAIDGAFLPLTEQPPVYDQIEDGVYATSGRKPVLRDSNGQKLIPTDAAYDPSPMVIRYEVNGSNILQAGDAGYGNNSNTRLVRFTDYTLDGEAQNFYFYFGVELSNTLKVSDRSPVTGPIQLVNSGPAKQPKIKKLETVLSSAALRSGPAIKFEMNRFVESENIKQFQVFRATDANAAQSVRTMKLVQTIDFGDPVIDDFSDTTLIPYGVPLFYRIVAMREIQNEQGNVEYVPSQASNLAMTNLVDGLNPIAPTIAISHGTPGGSPLTLPSVNLSWNSTAYNATYYLYKMNPTGTWTKIYSVDPSVHLNAANIPVDLIMTDLSVSTLAKEDADGLTIYHRFRVDVENSSGLFNLAKDEITI